MKREDFVKIAINNPKKGAKILEEAAQKLRSCKNVTKTAEVISDTIFISDRTVFRDAKK